MIEIVSLVLTSVLTLFVLNHFRAKKSRTFDLTPNVLLTQDPIVFIPGQQSLFYFSKYWNEAPDFLAQHGFEVYELNLPWRGPKRTAALAHWIEQQKLTSRTYHLFVDPESKNEIERLSDEIELKFKSIQTPDIRLDNILFRLHRFFIESKVNTQKCSAMKSKSSNGYESLLTQVRFLAEKDFSS